MWFPYNKLPIENKLKDLDEKRKMICVQNSVDRISSTHTNVGQETNEW